MTNEELVSEIQSGKTELIEVLWLQIEDLIKWAARRYFLQIMASGSTPGLEPDDLVQTAYFGLIEAVERYDPEQGTLFTTFLLWHVRRAFQSCIGRTERRRNDPLNNAVSLDIPIDNEDPDGSTRLDFVPDPRDQFQAADDRIFNDELRAALDAALDRLPANEARVLRGEFFESRTQTQLAEELSCSFQNIHQLKRNALHHIRHSSSRKKLEQFVDWKTDFYRGNGSVHATENKVVWREDIRAQYRKIRSKES